MGRDTNKRKHCLKCGLLSLWHGDPGARWVPGSRSLTATYAPYFLPTVLDTLLVLVGHAAGVAVDAILRVPFMLLWLTVVGVRIVGWHLSQLFIAAGVAAMPLACL